MEQKEGRTGGRQRLQEAEHEVICASREVIAWLVWGRKQNRIHGTKLMGTDGKMLKGGGWRGDDFQVSAWDGYKAVVSGPTRQRHGEHGPGPLSSTGEHDDFEVLGRCVGPTLDLESELESQV